MNQNNINRRQFLKGSGSTALTAATLLGTAQLGAISKAAAQSNEDYKALVCVLLAGGADSFNMLIPSDDKYYAQYKTTRTDLALGQNTLLALENAQNNGRTLALHPQMTGLQGLYNQGNLAFVSNLGTLVEPTSTAQLQSGAAKLPLGLFSHSDQISQWQTALPDMRSGTGWGGRIADIMGVQNSNQNISMNISTAGANQFQAGRVSDYYSIVPGTSPAPQLDGFNQDADVNAAIDEIYANQGFNNVFRKTYRNLFNSSVSANSQFNQAVQSAPAITATFAEDEFSQQMQLVAKTIAVNKSLGMRRQTFFVTYGGWDHHDEVINNMNRMVKALNDGLVSFQSAMTELGLDKQVTTFTASDFGRTLSSNGRGSDHAWGGNAMVMGGAVKGKKIYGTYPSLELGNPLDIGRGVLMPTTSLDEYFAELALWFGVSKGVLSDVLPNVARFYDVKSGNAPLGVLI